MKPLSLTILPTRKCNLKCSYCNIHDQHFPNELNWKQWVDNLKSLHEKIPSIGFTILLGGDVTTWGDDLPKFTKEMSKVGLPFAFTTNGVLLDETFLKKLKETATTSVSVSLDTLKNRADKHENIKSNTTMALLPMMNRLGFKDLHCTVTVDSTNLEEVPAIIKYLTSQKTYAEITPMLFGKSVAYDYTSSYWNLRYRLFTEKDKERIDAVMARIVAMKKEGYLIHNTDAFLLRWSTYGIRQHWKCRYPIGLVADADGSMRLCLQIKGDRVTKHNIGSLDFDKFLEDWHEDYLDNCQGCYWNCSYESKYVYEQTGSVADVEKYYSHGVRGLGL